MRVSKHLDQTAIKQAIAHFLSRQGSAEFDRDCVSLIFNSSTGEWSADALSRELP